MKITVFGATGRTGMKVVEQALARGMDVTAFVRSPNKLGGFKDQVKVVKGNVFSQDEVAAAIKGADAVISTLGPTASSKPGFQPEATKVIVQAMKQAKVQRLITMTGAWAKAPGDQPKLIDKGIVWFMNRVIKKVLTDGAGLIETVKVSKLDWTVVRAAVLINGEASGQFAVGKVGDGKLKPVVRRADVATFILDIAANGGHIHAMPVVASKK